MKRKILILCFLFQVFTTFSQKNELGNVTINELQLKQYSKDTTAVAAFLFKKAKTTFKYDSKKGFISSTEFSIKLKIYKKEGLKWANFEIPYYIGYKNLDDEYIDISKAYTYNLENDKIIKDKLNSEGKFSKKVNEFWATKSVTFPNVKIGSIIEFKYILKTENLSILPEFQFQYNIPVAFAEYETDIPEFYIYKGIKTGFIDIQKNDVIENTSQQFTSQFGQTQYLNYRQIKTNYFVNDVPALKEEKFVNNIDNYYAKIEHELQIIRMPDEKPLPIATTWEDVAKSIYKEKEFGEELEKKDYMIEGLRKLIDSTDSEIEKLNKIFNYTKNSMNWDGKYSYYTKKGVELAYKEKTGNVAEINLMLVSMLKLAGIKSSPVLISTRDNGIALFPNRTKFNYVIAVAIINGEKYLLDATNKNSIPNILPLRDLNWVGRSIEKDGSSTEIDLMPKGLSREFINFGYSINDKGNVTGNLRKQYSDYCAFDFRQNKVGINMDNYIDDLENKSNNIEVIDYSRNNENDVSKPIVETYSFKDSKSIEIINDKIYFSPLLFLAEKENPFKQETRQYPVDFGYPEENKFNINIEIPEGYVVESLPKPTNISTGENVGSFKYIIANTDNKIQVAITLDINEAIVSADFYEVIKSFYQQMIDKQNEKIVLKKI